MNRIRCFDVFNMVAEGLSEDFKDRYDINEAKLALLKKACDALDAVSAESDGIGFEVDISEETQEVSISLDFAYTIIVDFVHPEFFDILQENTRSMKIEKTETEDILKITFVFAGIWG